MTADFEEQRRGRTVCVVAGGAVHHADEGVRGKDYLVIHDGTFDVIAAEDSLKYDEDRDAELGYVLIQRRRSPSTPNGGALSPSATS